MRNEDLGRIGMAAAEQAALSAVATEPVTVNSLNDLAEEIVEQAKLPARGQTELTRRVQAALPVEEWLAIKQFCDRTGTPIMVFARAAILEKLERLLNVQRETDNEFATPAPPAP